LTSLRQRQPRIRDDGFLAFLRTLPCCVCGRAPKSEAAHIRMAALELGKANPGMAAKPDDRHAVPLCSWCHRDAPDAQHKGSERAFWDRLEIDPFAVAARLYARYTASLAGKPAGRPSIRPPRKAKPRPKLAMRPLFGQKWPEKRPKIPSRPFQKRTKP
jgi:hypothetical protein